jgi:hypothetical protein
MNSHELRNLQEAYMEVYDELDEGTSQDVADRAAKLERQRKGQTPKRQDMYRLLKNKAQYRANIEKRNSLGFRGGDLQNLVGELRGAGGQFRTKLTQSRRDEKRKTEATKWRSPYDPKYKKHTEGPGTITKNPKKLRKQKAMGEFGESYNLILSHLLDEASGGIIGGKNFPPSSAPLKQKPKNSSGIARKVRKSLSSVNFSLSSETPKDIVKRQRSHSNDTLNSLSRRSDEEEPGKGRSKSPRELQLKAIESEKRRRGIQKEQTDLYDIILSHLLDEGYADTQESAEVIMVNMSEDWMESICEGYKKLPVGIMLKQAARHSNPEQVTKMGEVADDHNPTKAKRKEDDNRRIGGRKRDAGRPRSNELQDNW